MKQNPSSPIFDSHVIVYVPRDMQKAVMERAAREMLSASAWVRKVVLDRLQTETP